jgi:hypothetical protein
VKPGFETTRTDLFLPSGGQREWVVDLVPVPTSVVERSSAPGYVLATGGALSGVLLAAGILFDLSADRAGRSARDLQAGLNGSCSEPSNAPDCAMLKRREDRQHQLQRVSDIGLISSAGCAAVTALVYTWMMSGQESATDQPVSQGVVMGAVVGHRQASVQLSGQF